jgi:hypothetical protein
MAQTYGKAKANIWNSKAYFKPSLHKLVIRSVGVNRKSPAVMQRNATFASAKPAAGCAGRSWPEFVACMSQALGGKRAMAKAAKVY